MGADRILVTGANGQLGSALVPHLCNCYGADNVLATDIRKGDDAVSRFELLDVTDRKAVAGLTERFRITQVYHLAAILSAKGEKDPLATWDVNTSTFLNVLEVARLHRLSSVFFPSSIAVFGEGIDRQLVGQGACLVPATAYGISKAASETWANYYYRRYGLDVRSLRYPGVIGYQSLPGGGTTDYAVEIYHKAILGEEFTCFLRAGTTLPMIYMDDAITATLRLMEAPAHKLKTRTSYNLAGLSFSPDELVKEIKKYFPAFKVTYKPDFRQEIAASWPEKIDDTDAREQWGWKPEFNLAAMTADMIVNLERKYKSKMTLK